MKGKLVKEDFNDSLENEKPTAEIQLKSIISNAQEILDNLLQDNNLNYLEFLLHSDPRVAIKFTRMHHHLDVLKKIAPDGRLLLAVRDPRAVASSYLYGRGQKHRGIYETEQDFFKKSTNRNPWSMRALSNELIGEHYPGTLFSDLERVLLLWKHKNQKMIKDGEYYFESRHKVMRHEYFLLDAPAAMNSVFDFLELEIGAAQYEWAKTNIQRTSSLPYKNSVFWDEVFAKLEMSDLVASLGY